MTTTPAEPRPDRPLPVIGVKPQDLPPAMLVVGDPQRAEQAAQLLTDTVELARTREYVTFRGIHEGSPVGVISHGVGAAGAALAFEGLCKGGVERIIRCGTAGGMQADVVDGDLVIATSAVREDGYTDLVVPPGYPAVASLETSRALMAAAEARSRSAHLGMVLTSSLFFPMDVLGGTLKRWHRAGVVAVEMECSALFVIASQYRREVGAVLAIDGNPLAAGDADMADYNPNRETVRSAVADAIEIGLTALVTRAW